MEKDAANIVSSCPHLQSLSIPGLQQRFGNKRLQAQHMLSCYCNII